MKGDIVKKIDNSRFSYEQIKNCFSSFSKEEIDEIGSYLEYCKYPAGESIWNQGDPPGFMVFLVKGKVLVKKETEFSGKYILLAVLENGSLLGEISTVTSQKRSATVTVVESSHGLVLSQGNVARILQESPPLSVKLLTHIVTVAGLRLQQSASRLAELL